MYHRMGFRDEGAEEGRADAPPAPAPALPPPPRLAGPSDEA
jgi:hypothetical protein